jgi:hypothetical protein
MNRYFVFMTLFVAIANSAFAGTPPCVSYAGMADLDKDGYCVFVGTADATSTGWAGDVDCDDSDVNIHPGKTEVVGDEIDQDCDNDDLVMPVSDTVFGRFVSGEYKGKAPSAILFIEEYGRCKAATGRCSVDANHGRFVIADPAVDVFADIYVGVSRILRTDGIREVVSLEEASHYVKPPATYSGPSKAQRTQEATEAAKPLVDQEKSERIAADEALDGRVSAVERSNTDRDRVITAALDRQDTEETARKDGDRASMAAVATAAQRAETAVTAASTAKTRADDAYEVAEKALSHGPLFEAGVLGGGIFQLGLAGQERGEMVRGPVLGAGGLELRAGVDGDGYEVAGFGQLTVGGEGTGTGPDTALLVGAEVLGEVTHEGLAIGGFAAFARTENHGNVLDVTVVEQGLVFGPTLGGDFLLGEGRISPFVRLGAGPTWVAFRGYQDGIPIPEALPGVVALLQGGIRFGVGAKTP